MHILQFVEFREQEEQLISQLRQLVKTQVLRLKKENTLLKLCYKKMQSDKFNIEIKLED